MTLHWTFGRKIAAGFAVTALVMAVLAVVGHRSVDQLIENDRLVSHTQQVRRELARLVAENDEAETGQRGFIITGDESYLAPYERAVDAIEKTFADLRQLLSDNPAQQRRLDAVRSVVDTRLAVLRRSLEARRTGGFDAAQRSVATGDGKRAMEQLRRLAGEMQREEEDLLERRRDASEESARTTKAILVWGSVAGILFVLFVATFLARSLVEQIGSAVRHMQSSSAELQAAATQQATGAKEQATALTEVNTTINELLATSRQIAQSAERVAGVAEATAAAARAGEATVASGKESIGGIGRQVELIVTHMLDLGKKSQQIGAVLDIVSELAEQTNILAINATIEAAGAGEAGARFGVVAEEIRKLADRVGGSTKEIRALIDDVRSAVNATVMTTETGSKATEAGARQFADVAAAFERIAGLVETTTEVAQEIGLSTKQQSSAVEQVTVAVTNVALASKESEISTGQTLATASELASLSRELLRIVEVESRRPSAR